MIDITEIHGLDVFIQKCIVVALDLVLRGLPASLSAVLGRDPGFTGRTIVSVGSRGFGYAGIGSLKGWHFLFLIEYAGFGAR